MDMSAMNKRGTATTSRLRFDMTENLFGPVPGFFDILHHAKAMGLSGLDQKLLHSFFRIIYLILKAVK